MEINSYTLFMKVSEGLKKGENKKLRAYIRKM